MIGRIAIRTTAFAAAMAAAASAQRAAETFDDDRPIAVECSEMVIAVEQLPARFEIPCSGPGTVFLSAKADMCDPFLIAREGVGTPLRDDDGGGGRTAFIELRVSGATNVVVDVDAKQHVSGVLVTIRSCVAPSTSRSLELAAKMDALRIAAPAERAAGRSEDLAREIIAVLEEVADDPDARQCGSCALAAWFLLAPAGELRLHEIGLRTNEWIRDFRVVTHPSTARRLLDSQRSVAWMKRSLGRRAEALAELECVRAKWAELGDANAASRIEIDEMIVILTVEKGNVSEAATRLKAAAAAYAEIGLEARATHALQNVGAMYFQGGDLAAARGIYLDLLANTDSASREQRADWSMLVARCSRLLGHRADAISQGERTLADVETWRPPDATRLLQARRELAAAVRSGGTSEGETQSTLLLESAIREAETELPADHADLAVARADLAAAWVLEGRAEHAYGLLAPTVQMFRESLALARRDREVVQRYDYVRLRLANAAALTDRLDEAATVLNELIAEHEVRADPFDDRAQRARLCLAGIAMRRGDFGAARREIDRIASWAAQFEQHSEERLEFEVQLATLEGVEGRLRESRVRLGALIAAVEGKVSRVQPKLLNARIQLCRALMEAGDSEGSRREFLALWDDAKAEFPEAHSNWAALRFERSQQFMARLRYNDAAADLAFAIDSYARRNRPRDVLALQLSLVEALRLAGRGEEADALLPAIDASLAAGLGDWRQEYRRDLFVANRAEGLGDVAGALAASRRMLEACEHNLTRDSSTHDLVILSEAARRVRLHLDAAASGDVAALSALRVAALEVANRGVDWLREVAATDAPAMAEAAADDIASEVDDVVTAACVLPASPVRDEIAAAAFRLAESTRSVALVAARLERLAAGSDASTRARLAAARAALRVAGGCLEDVTSDVGAADFAGRVRERDLRAREARALVTARVNGNWPDVGRLQREIPACGTAVTFRESRHGRTERVHLVAWVLEHGAPIRVVDLGESATIDAAANAWRDGLMMAHADAASTRADAQALAQLVLAPIANALASADRVDLAPCGSLARVPLDALPDPADEHSVTPWFERATVRTLPSLALALEHGESVRSEATAPFLVAVGGVAFDASGPTAMRAEEASLPYSLVEATRLARAFEARFGSTATATLLSGREASAEALLERVESATYVHFATHSRTDVDAADVRIRFRMGAAPLARVALRLAREETRDGLRGDEIATLDLSRCELAVLATCNSAMGLEVAGQGMQSLATAVQAAGARATVASLWPVDDASSARFFEEFYSAAWTSGWSPAFALREAKRAMRRARLPESSYSGWVVSSSGSMVD